jgi:hypothetical protein
VKTFLLVNVLLFLALGAACQSAPSAASTASPAMTVSPAVEPAPDTAVAPPVSPTLTATPRAGDMQATAGPALSPTPIPSSPPSVVATLNCPALPAGSFAGLWQSHSGLQASLGCPTSAHPRIAPDAWEVMTSYQTFERGAMLWSDHIGWYPQPVVYVLYADSRFDRFEDTADPTAVESGESERPPEGLRAPGLGFGEVWRTQPGVRAALGWATSSESPGAGRFQMFTGGDMVWASQTDQTYVFQPKLNVVSVFDIGFFR